MSAVRAGQKPSRKAAEVTAQQYQQRLFAAEIMAAAATQLLTDALPLLPDGEVKVRVERFLAANRK